MCLLNISVSVNFPWKFKGSCFVGFDFDDWYWFFKNIKRFVDNRTVSVGWVIPERQQQSLLTEVNHWQWFIRHVMKDTRCSISVSFCHPCGHQPKSWCLRADICLCNITWTPRTPSQRILNICKWSTYSTKKLQKVSWSLPKTFPYNFKYW